ncbi:lysophospholipid acyltransferase family protein [Piscinibacter sp.]|uniref:lysophospholipid acyltransferase family protein n=1 Tax=Piscinibacter sp. TaxID=1903157 RepID=UPI002CC557F5|nr:lysophospholipid acyltransferase family protein [Albitalea sp.]HUG24743.1 lysophospholipid acyltransferase family protein [Albitalea sp.]
MQTLFWSIRSLLFVLWLSATVVPWAVLSLVASVFIRGTPLYWLTTYWLRFAIWGARVICGVRWRLIGLDNLAVADRAGPMIVLPKHQSTWETFAFPQLMPHPLCYVFKRELLMIPFFGWAMSRLDMVHIDRSRRAEAWNRVAEQGRRFMAQGNWVIMFPEGTRAPRGGQGVYKAGGSRLAVDTGATVLPIAVTSARCWPRKSFVLRPGVIDVSIGKPIPSTGREPDELMREVESWIEGEMRRLDPEAYAPGARPGA